MSSTDSEQPAAQTEPPAIVETAPKPAKAGKGKKPPAPPAADVGASENRCEIGDTVIYTGAEAIQHRYKWREMGNDYAAIVTFVKGDEVCLFVMPPNELPFSAEAVPEGEGFHTWRIKTLPF